MNQTDVQVDFWNVGQGDASTITFPNGELWVIDVGPFGSSISRWFADSRRVHHIKTLILTHNDADHIGGLEAIVNAENVTIDTVYLLQDCHPRGEITKIVSMLLKKTLHIKRLECENGDRLTIAQYDKYSVELRYPSTRDNLLAARSNETSGMVVLSYEARDCISWGGDNLLDIMVSHTDGGVDMQFGPHHGAPQDPPGKISYAVQLLAPCRCFISVGSHNQYRHPGKHFLRELRKVGCIPMCSQITRNCSEKLYSNNESIYNSCALYCLPPPSSSAISCWGHVRFFLKSGVFELDQRVKLVPEKIKEKIKKLSCSTACTYYI